MSKAVLISIRPKWCELIASGRKTIEVRKTAPKIDIPFKCYIYCTKGEPLLYCRPSQRIGNGLVIGEFVCDQIEEIAVARRGGDGPLTARGGNEVWNGGMVEHMSCLSTEDICRYVGGIGRVGRGWHISILRIYEKPKALSEFHSCSYCDYRSVCPDGSWCQPLKRPPQSWCYVAEQ